MRRRIAIQSVLAVVLCLVSAAFGADRLVPSPYSTIQAAIDDCNDGDMVLVADGTYMGDGNRNIDFNGLAITVRSVGGPNECIIDCNRSGWDTRRGFYFHSGEDGNSVLEGFTIKKGFDPNGMGGGIHCSGSSPVIRDCIITDNGASSYVWSPCGGGIFCYDSSATIENCIISDNGAEPYYLVSFLIHAYGGGIYLEGGSPKIIGCEIKNNTAKGSWCDYPTTYASAGDGYGGGIYSSSSAEIRDCYITGNEARGNDGFSTINAGSGCGGGIHGSSSTTVENCLITGNSARGGYADTGMMGGTAIGSESMYPAGETFDMNGTPTPTPTPLPTPTPYGGGEGGDGYGGGIYGSVTVSNCTITGNNATAGSGAPPGTALGDGVYGSATIIDSIIWGNDSSEVYGGPTITYSDIKGGFTGTGNIDSDPCFVSGPGGDYYLSQTAAGQAVDSNCVDAGSDTAVNLGMDEATTRTDHIGDAGVVDMGYHYAPTPTPTPTECFPSGHADYAMWLSVGKPTCWCPAPDGSDHQCQGDADGAFAGKDKDGKRQWVTGNDFDVLLPGWQKFDNDPGFSTFICADFNHAFSGKDKDGKRQFVTGDDFDVLLAHWQKVDTDPCFTDYSCFP